MGEGAIARLLYYGGIRLSGLPRASHRELIGPNSALHPAGRPFHRSPRDCLRVSSAPVAGSLHRFHPHPPRDVSFLCRCPPSREVPCGTAAPVRWAELPRVRARQPPAPSPSLSKL
ncbi:RNAsep RNA [Pyrococcus abyssi GE5]|uniref:RNaseP RNA n=1 Tax=Pyrococcus abyssi (strain GE5 / Orsay) TaxID=272844 RepID=Q9V299_PYRAB|nr:RNAsep RNA [Pyrococcus abyssi GE5]CCE69551.1 TPA: RnaseP RNA [Pyrococcus abyssi GE5]